MKKHEKRKFQIDQLRKDIIIYMLESIALTFIVELGYILISIILQRPYSKDIALVALIIPLAYFIYMLVQSTIKRTKINKLENKLYNEK